MASKQYLYVISQLPATGSIFYTKSYIASLLKRGVDFLRWKFKINRFIISKVEDRKIFKISADIFRIAQESKDKQILFLPSYYQIGFSRLIDIVLALSLILRGCRVTPVLRKNFYATEDIIFGGIYNKYRTKKIAFYDQVETLIWVALLRTKPLYLSSFVSQQERSEITNCINSLSVSGLKNLTISDYPIGYQAVIATCNLSNEPRFIESGVRIQQLREHAINIVLLLIAYGRIYKSTDPTAIYSEFPHYYHWHTAYFVAKKQKQHFVSSIIAEKKNSWFFASNSDVLHDGLKAWHHFSRTISKKDRAFAAEAIQQRKNRTVSHSSLYTTSSDKHMISKIEESAKKGKVIFFPVNVLFDLAVFKPSALFEDIIEMLFFMIAYAKQHPEVTLIIKAHPAEKIFYAAPFKNASNYCLKNLFKRLRVEFSENVIFIDCFEKITTFDIIPYISKGVVYSSTTALEMCWFNKPVISCSENLLNSVGVVQVPQSRSELVRLLQDAAMPSDVFIEQTAIDYYLYYYYYTFISFGLVQGNDTGEVSDSFLFDSHLDLLPGKNESLDYICNAIMYKKEVFSKDTCPPKTL